MSEFVLLPHLYCKSENYESDFFPQNYIVPLQLQ